MTLNEIKTNLPPEGQKWLDGLSPNELAGTQTMLELVGEESFCANWPTYKAEVDHLRHYSKKGRL